MLVTIYVAVSVKKKNYVAAGNFPKNMFGWRNLKF